MPLHVDKWNGVSVEKPEGWFVEHAKGVLSVRRDPSGMTMSVVYAANGSSAASADTLARTCIAAARATDPSYTAWRAPELDPQGGIHLRTQGTFLGRRIEGRFRVTASGGTGVLAGFLAPAEELAALAPTLSAILTSVKSVPAIPRTIFRDPAEGAFIMGVPAGFMVRGGTIRQASAGGVPRFVAEIQDPTGTLRGSIPPESFYFSEPSPMGMFGAFLGLGGMGAMMGLPSRPYRPASEFGRDWVAPQRHPGARVTAAHERFDLVQAGLPELAKRGLLGSVDCSIGVVDLLHDERGVARRECLLVTVSRLRGSGSWFGSVDGAVSTPADRWDEWWPILGGSLGSLEENPAWRGTQDAQMNAFLLQQQQERSARLQDISRTLSATSDVIVQGYNQRQKVYDRISHDRSNAILGRQDMVDGSGHIWNVPTGHEQYWKDGYNQIHGGGLLDRPDPRWERLDPAPRPPLL